MSLFEILKTHCQIAIKAITKPTNLLIAGVTLGSLLSFSDVQGQSDSGDQYADGVILTKNAETGFSEPDVNITLKSHSMSMYNPNVVYNYISNSGGVIEYDSVLVFKDSTTSIQQYFQDNTMVLPNFGSDINVFLPQDAKGVLQYITINRQIAKQKEFSGDNVHMNLSNIAAGMGIYRVLLEDGIAITGKYVKQYVPSKGPSSRPIEIPSLKKGMFLYEAEYWMIWEKEGFVTDSMLITLHDGTNSPVFANIQPINANVPQHQDLIGTAKKSKDEGYGPLANITAILYNQTTNETETVVTGSDGKFVFNDVPAGSICFVSVGGNVNRYSFNDIEYIVPSSIQTMNDTIADIFSTVLDLKLASTTAQHIAQQTENGTQSQVRKVWYDTNLPSGDKPIYESYFDQLESMSDDYTYIETTNQNEAHIKIYDGNYNTGTDPVIVVTPLGKYYPIDNATVTMEPGNFGAFCHEIYQANGKSQVGWYSILGPSPPSSGPTQEDLDIAELEMNYWVYAVYADQETHVDLNLISEDLQTKSPQCKGNLGSGF